MLLSWAIGKGFTVGARFRYSTGYPRTPVVGSFYEARDDLYQPLFGAQNSIRIPGFYQLDVRAEKQFAFVDFIESIACGMVIIEVSL
mgnify:CR=1 FL=1